MGDYLPRSIQPGRRPVTPFRLAGLAVAVLLCMGSACRSSTLSMPSRIEAPPISHRPTIQLPRPTVLSIFAFEDRTRKSELAWLRTGLTDMLVAELAGHSSLTVVQRERVEEIIREQALHVSGRVSDHSTVKIGRLIGANVVMTGRLIIVDALLRIDAQFISVEEGAVLGAVTAEGPVQDGTNVARLLVAKTHALLLGGRDESSSTPSDILATVPSDSDSERVSRKHKLFETLAELERAHAIDSERISVPNKGGPTPERLSPDLRLDPGPPPSETEIADRLVERLSLGLEAELGTPVYDESSRDGKTLRVPVRIRFSSSVLDNMLSALRRTEGVSLQGTENHEMEIQLDMRPPTGDSLAYTHALSRRFYLRLLARDGRTIAVYSDFYRWRVSNWMAVDESTIRIRRDRVVDSEARFGGLSTEQGEAIASIRMTLDGVPKERATVRVDIQTVTDQPPSSGGEAAGSGNQPSRHVRATKLDAALSESVVPLRLLMEGAWSPPIYERPWSSGYIPTNERTSVITVLLDPIRRQVREEPRLVRSSGEKDFDRAALTAMRTGLEGWLSSQGFDSLIRAQAAPDAIHEANDRAPSVIKLRAQFQLRKDVPGLHLLAPPSLDPHSYLPLTDVP